MAKIQILNEYIAARIAAGEVVERPASIVKELVENAVDAGATSVSISIQDGGIRQIRVVDNGGGISREDMPLTLVKHATSKIASLEDLEHIGSMGFRGEALFSIAAVSHMTIRSRTPEAEMGTELVAQGGKVSYIRDAGLPEGTSVLVENLFFNTPARLKFLKKPSAEAAAISELVSRLILAYPGVSIQYASNGTPIYHSPGNGSLEDAILSVYGSGIRKNLLTVKGEFRGIAVYGCVGAPSMTYRSTKYGSCYVNQRYVKSDVVGTAVLNAYGERLLKGNHPFYVLHITLPLEDVDSNVHPNKLTVHFADPAAVASAVTLAVEHALSSYATPSIHLGVQQTSEEIAFSEKEKTPSVEKAANSLKDAQIPSAQGARLHTSETKMSSWIASQVVIPQETKKSQDELQQEERPWMDLSKIEMPLEMGWDVQPGWKEPILSKASDAKEENAEIFSLPDEETCEEAQAPSLMQGMEKYEILGTVFSCYIAIEAGETFYLVDQHAAHERLLYDKLIEQERGRRVIQRLLVPEELEVNPSDIELLKENSDLLEKLGLELVFSGPHTCKILGVPQVLGTLAPKELMGDILESLDRGQKSDSFTLRLDRVAKAACKRAVKAGDRLTRPDIDLLVHLLLTSKTIPHCPHGRPVAVALTKADVEKSFKRRV